MFIQAGRKEFFFFVFFLLLRLRRKGFAIQWDHWERDAWLYEILIHHDCSRGWGGFDVALWRQTELPLICYARLTWMLSLWWVFFFFFLIADVKSKLFFFKTNSTKELREHNFFYTSKSKRAGLSFRATNNEGQFPFHKFCVSPNPPANEVFPGFFKVKSNELFHHEATAVSDGNSWPNTYSCWDRSSQFSPFMTKL